jgi:hypothetical protein
MSTALGDVGSAKAVAVIANQMRTLVAGDVLYATIVRPEINGVLAERGLEGDEVPPSAFVPGGSEWLDEARVTDALAAVSGATGAATPGVHGLGLLSTAINGAELTPEATTAVSVEETPEVEVQVQNQGESTENGITVTVTVDGGSSVQGTVNTIAAGETSSLTIPLTPAPSGTATLEVEVKPVPGEQVADNNRASYTVEFQ